MRVYKVGVIIPAYNEGRVIKDVLATIPEKVKKKNHIINYVPIVVDDGSSDKTSEIVSKINHVVIIRHLINLGPGAATRTGLIYLKENGFNYGATMDADGQHSYINLQDVVYAVIKEQGDFIIGSRLINSAANMPWYKVVGNKGLNFITKLLLGVSSSDSQSGLKAFNRKTIDKLDYNENGFAFCSEMIWRAKKAGLKINEIPIEAIYTKYSKAKGQSNWNAFYIIRQLIRHRFLDFIHD